MNISLSLHFLNTTTLLKKTISFLNSLIPIFGAVADPLTYKNKKILLFPLARDVPIFRIGSKFESFHSSCSKKFFVENWHT